ncbi:cation efflux protein (plasmid) [Emticicia oligotrophica DSM 17448]|uniref:Cation efflux protein n=1 Tax=Emticicia oligotrophica (strain DSM 17448 / CIP 109782 / MTCC 6937 / GPTSA100-15) TaxID=929562 RepID=A0ABN4AXB7_EMTOG|nr:cation transporter [Emticicia oligotrophica]AFK05682.1 cation efflux protein [Emticicia oligotrophica DSM 17448]
MLKTTFKISKMDCPSEEQMIRMKLADLTDIEYLDFDIPNRQLTVFHNENYDQIFQRLDDLKFDTSIINSISVDNHESSIDNKEGERKLLWQVLLINFFFFALELITGFISNSVGLVADSLDMLADSIVYGLALFAVGGTIARKKNIAKSAGYFQLILAFLGLMEVIRRFVGIKEVPVFQTMVIISMLALVGNGLCLYLLQKSKSKDAHMQASMIFTSNDVVVNLGVIVAGGLVYLTNSKFPDLIVGTIVFLIVGQGAFKILKLSN